MKEEIVYTASPKTFNVINILYLQPISTLGGYNRRRRFDAELIRNLYRQLGKAIWKATAAHRYSEVVNTLYFTHPLPTYYTVYGIV